MNTQETVGQLVAEKIARAAVFERLGIDYCCGGKLSLNKACAEKGLNPDDVIRELELCENQITDMTQDWLHASLTDLANHIEKTHHAYLKRELPRLSALISKVAKVHGAEHPEIIKVNQIFQDLAAEMDMHMRKEEHILFPFCRQLESATTMPQFHCGSIANPIFVMEHEHEQAGHALQAFNTLTNGYKVPAGVCRSYEAMLAGLAQLEADMHQHVHKENNILFPRAKALEEKLAGAALR
jgi:regulator of cell morphogenesis and NO signaling